MGQSHTTFGIVSAACCHMRTLHHVAVHIHFTHSEGVMSDTTLQAIHDAIAAHIADENDATEYLTEWILTAAAVVSNDAELTSYWFLHPKGTPYHHRLGLAHRGLELLVDP